LHSFEPLEGELTKNSGGEITQNVGKVVSLSIPKHDVGKLFVVHKAHSIPFVWIVPMLRHESGVGAPEGVWREACQFTSFN
jgi:hypothetical protein